MTEVSVYTAVMFDRCTGQHSKYWVTASSLLEAIGHATGEAYADQLCGIGPKINLDTFECVALFPGHLRDELYSVKQNTNEAKAAIGEAFVDHYTRRLATADQDEEAEQQAAWAERAAHEYAADDDSTEGSPITKANSPELAADIIRRLIDRAKE